MALHPDYATLEEGRDFLRITDVTDTSDDEHIQIAITAASRSIDRAANRQFGTATSAVARIYTAEWSKTYCAYIVPIDDLMTATGLVVKGSTADDGVFDTTYTDFRLLPINAAGDERPWTHILFGSGVNPPTAMASIEVTAKWGWLGVPETILTACLLQMSRYLKRRDAPFGVAGSPEMGNELRLLARLDPDVEVMLGDYRRWWSAA